MEYRDNYGPAYRLVAANRERCAELVHDRDGWGTHQCQRKAICDPDESGKPTTCRQHSEQEVAKRQAKQQADYDKETKRLRVGWAGPKMKAALIEIAKGHNDPRALAASILAEQFPGEELI